MQYPNSRLIITIAIGSDPCYRYGIESLKRYAQRVEAELVVIRDYLINPSPGMTLQQSAWLQKAKIFEYSQEYAYVLYVDSDILISPSSPNIFNLLEEDSEIKVAVYDESSFGQRLDYLKSMEKIGFFNSKRVDRYFNAGVILLKNGNFFEKLFSLNELQVVINSNIRCPEQTYFNFLAVNYYSQIRFLDRRFNYMERDPADRNSRFEGYFIHYAGYSFRQSKRQKRSHVMRSDYYHLYRPAFKSFGFRLIASAVYDFVFDAINSMHKEFWRVSNNGGRR